jgi:hypothetical protein
MAPVSGHALSIRRFDLCALFSIKANAKPQTSLVTPGWGEGNDVQIARRPNGNQRTQKCEKNTVFW